MVPDFLKMGGSSLEVGRSFWVDVWRRSFARTG